MPDECKSVDTVEAYREYYAKEKSYLASWDRAGKIPNWYENKLKEMNL